MVTHHTFQHSSTHSVTNNPKPPTVDDIEDLAPAVKIDMTLPEVLPEYAHDVPVRNRKRESCGSKQFLASSRYRVTACYDDPSTCTKIVEVAPYTTQHTTTPLNPTLGTLYLRGDWYDCQVLAGDVLNVVSVGGEFYTTVSYLPLVFHSCPPSNSRKDDLLLVLHPDSIIAPSYISEHTTCRRRAVLKMRLRGAGFKMTKDAVLGNFRHQLFQTGLEMNDVTKKNMRVIARTIVEKNTETIIAANLTENEAMEELVATHPQASKFVSAYTNFNDDAMGDAEGSLLKGMDTRAGWDDVHFRATGVYAVEEEAFLPSLGMKGFVDLTLEAELRTRETPFADALTTQKCLIPLELKTGHKQEVRPDHSAQLSLYTLMLRAIHGSAMTRQPQISPGFLSSPKTPSKSLTDTSNSSAAVSFISPINAKKMFTPHTKRTWQKNSISRLGSGRGGMLLYLNSKGMEARHIKPAISELKTLFSIRNELAYNIRKSEEPRGLPEVEGLTPPPIRATVLPKLEPSVQVCKRCFSKTECMVYRKVQMHVEGKTKLEGNELDYNEVLSEETKHLTPVHLQYFQNWDRMLDLELSEANVNIVKSWLVPALDRETQTGRTIANMVWKNYHEPSDKKETSYVLLFERGFDGDLRFRLGTTTPMSQRDKKFALTNLVIDKGNRVVISTDHVIAAADSSFASDSRRQQLHIVKGDVVKIMDSSISIKCSGDQYQRLSNVHASWGEREGNPLRFRIDVDEFATSGGALRQNLVDLLSVNKKWLREIVIDTKIPEFMPINLDRMFTGTADGRPEGVHGCDLNDLMMEFYELNEDQRNAVTKIVHAKDYTIVQGLPGTGKTSTVAYVVRLLVARGKRVMVTSYTHAAVDNLLLNLMKFGVGCGEGRGDMLRIGTDFSVHKDCMDLMPRRVASDKYGVILDDEEEFTVSADVLMRVMQDAKIVGVTCLTAPKTPLLVGSDFDVVIVDEAGQIAQPAILGSLGKATNFVLVGDHMQLPPLVRDNNAIAAGYDVSLLRRLAERVPSSVAQLTLQYRMHEDIVSLCNIIAYKGALRCGNTMAAKGLIEYGEGWRETELVKSGGALAVVSGLKCDWLMACLAEDNVARFIDTDGLGTDLESYGRTKSGRKGGTSNIMNGTEINLIVDIVKALQGACQVDLKDVGIISHYRSQVRSLRSNEQLLEFIDLERLEVATIDTYQGRDKKVIIVSFVRSNDEGTTGQLLADFRRINVALSRAKMKLILVGSRKTLSKGSECMKELLEGMAEKGWINELRGAEGDGVNLFPSS